MGSYHPSKNEWVVNGMGYQDWRPLTVSTYCMECTPRVLVAHSMGYQDWRPLTVSTYCMECTPRVLVAHSMVNGMGYQDWRPLTVSTCLIPATAVKVIPATAVKVIPATAVKATGSCKRQQAALPATRTLGVHSIQYG